MSILEFTLMNVLIHVNYVRKHSNNHQLYKSIKKYIRDLTFVLLIIVTKLQSNFDSPRNDTHH